MKENVELFFLSKFNKSYESYVKCSKSYRKSYASRTSLMRFIAIGALVVLVFAVVFVVVFVVVETPQALLN